MANYMKEVAKLLGLEIEETFRIKGEEPYFRFTEEDFESSNDIIEWTMAPSVHLRCILTGEVTIVKKWKPREGEKYYVPRIAIRPYDRHYYYYWDNSGVDIKRYKMGIVCKTPEEAIALTEKMLVAINEQ